MIQAGYFKSARIGAPEIKSQVRVAVVLRSEVQHRCASVEVWRSIHGQSAHAWQMPRCVLAKPVQSNTGRNGCIDGWRLCGHRDSWLHQRRWPRVRVHVRGHGDLQAQKMCDKKSGSRWPHFAAAAPWSAAISNKLPVFSRFHYTSDQLLGVSSESHTRLLSFDAYQKSMGN